MDYVDSAQIVKCYLNDPTLAPYTTCPHTPVPLYSSALCIPEVTCAIHRRYREGTLTRKQAQAATAAFRSHVEMGHGR